MEVVEASGSWQKGDGRGLECPLTLEQLPFLAFHFYTRARIAKKLGVSRVISQLSSELLP